MFRLVLLILSSCLSLTVQATPTGEDTANSALDGHNLSITGSLLAQLPPAVVCEGGPVLNLKDAKVDLSASSVLFLLPADGEQEFGYILQVNDLQALVSGKISKLKSASFSGYWWSDGDHVNFGTDVECLKGN